VADNTGVVDAAGVVVVTVVIVFVVDWLPSAAPVELGPHDVTAKELINGKRK
jgi:hypothetical protein